MNKVLIPVLSLILLLSLFRPLDNGSRAMALVQFESAKASFNHQDYFDALRKSFLARVNEPSAPGPWLLAGHCFYLQGKDQAALFHYSRATALDPAVKLPSFAQLLRSKGPSRAASLAPKELFSLRRRIGQMLMVSVPAAKLSGQKKALLNAGWIGGVILFNQNVESKTQVTGYIGQLQDSSPVPLFVAVDQEGGAVRRFTEDKGFKHLPSLAALGRANSTGLAYKFGLLSGAQLREVGANLNLAPVVDLDHGVADSIINKFNRSLGKDPATVTSLAGEIIRGMREANVIATAKHFPTQSVASANPHLGSSTTTKRLQDLEAEDFLPYRRLIRAGLLDSIMLSHVVYKDIDPYFPASLSTELVQNLLRGELGYQGLVISDDLRMDAIKGRFPLEVSVVQAVNAGVDILLVTDNMERRVMDCLVEAVVSGRIARATIDKAYKRIMATKEKYGIVVTHAPRPQAEVRALVVPDQWLKGSGKRKTKAGQVVQTPSTRPSGLLKTALVPVKGIGKP